MSTDILNNLNELTAYSGKSLNSNIVEGLMSGSTSGNPYIELVRPNVIGNNNFRWDLNGGAESIRSKKNQTRRSKIKTFDEDGFITTLNAALKGGTRYPILSAVTGILFGKVSAGMGLLFSSASATGNMIKTSQEVIARPGDELWKVEEIGKVKSGHSYKMVHIYSLFLVDPFRDSSRFSNIGWLIHEERKDVHVG